jgi:hypothetical protein
VTTCIAADPRLLDQAFTSLVARLDHDDRGSRILLSMPPSCCGLCKGQLKIEDHAARVMSPCAVAVSAARLKTLLAQVSPSDPAGPLARATSVPLSMALVDRLHKSVTHRIGASFAPDLPAVALAARAAWMFGAKTAVFDVNDEVAAAHPPGAPEVVFLHLNGKAWEERTGVNLEQWISWCQRSGAALWVAAPAAASPQGQDSPGGRHWGKVSRQVAARVAKARERHWTGWLSSQARSRLLEVCEAGSFFDK